MANRNLKCSERIDKEYEDTIKTIRSFNGDFDQINEYGLCFDCVEPGTFEDQRERYWRWQLSWGGPSDEFRLYENGDLEYWFLDWFDGDYITVENEDYDLIYEIMDDFRSCL